MKYGIRHTWVEVFNLMVKRPVVLLPFVFVAFFEALALELIYFSPRMPLVKVFGPVIRKFFGESYLHYPGNMLGIGKFFYYAQVVIYVFLGAMLAGISINIFKNIRENLPLMPAALVKNALKRYYVFFAYGFVLMVSMHYLNKAGSFVFPKIAGLIGKILPAGSDLAIYLIYVIAQFVVSIAIYTLVISILPYMIIEKRSLLMSFILSLYSGVRHFFAIFALICLPFMFYLPFVVLKSFPAQLADKLFPEVNALVIVGGIVVSIFADCFLVLSAAQRVYDRSKDLKAG